MEEAGPVAESTIEDLVNRVLENTKGDLESMEVVVQECTEYVAAVWKNRDTGAVENEAALGKQCVVIGVEEVIYTKGILEREMLNWDIEALRASTVIGFLIETDSIIVDSFIPDLIPIFTHTHFIHTLITLLILITPLIRLNIPHIQLITIRTQARVI